MSSSYDTLLINLLKGQLSSPPKYFCFSLPTFSLTLQHLTYHTCCLFIVTKVAFHCSMTLGTLVCFIHCYQPVPTIVFGT